MNFCLSYYTNLLSRHRIVLKIHTKEPTKSPNLIASLPKSIKNRWEGLLTILFKPKTVERPALMR
jgi:hypothetical protein